MTKLIPYTYQDKHGTYYVRYVFSKKCRLHLPNLSRDIRRTLKTNNFKRAVAISQWYISYWELIIGQLHMAQYRDKAHYHDVLKSVDYFQDESGMLKRLTDNTREESLRVNLISMVDPHGH